MTIITNLDAFVRVTDANVRAFFLNILGINLTGKNLRIRYDSMGQIAEINADVVLTGPEVTLLEAEFFFAVTDKSFISTFVVRTPDTQVAFSIGTSNTPRDINISGEWVEGEKVGDLSLNDSDIGEIKNNSPNPMTVLVVFSTSMSVITGSDRRLFITLMRTPDGGATTEIPGTRSYNDSPSSTNGGTETCSIHVILQPLETLRINIGTFGHTDIIGFITGALTVTEV